MAFTWHQLPTWARSVQRQAEMLFLVLKAAQLHPQPRRAEALRSAAALCCFPLRSQHGQTPGQHPPPCAPDFPFTPAFSQGDAVRRAICNHSSHCWRVTAVCFQMSMGWQLTSVVHFLSIEICRIYLRQKI